MKLVIISIILIFIISVLFISQLDKMQSVNLSSSFKEINTRFQNQSAIFNSNIPAPELTGITAWLNTNKQLTLMSLRGKVVLVDFWTNQCINCIHTLPFVTKWYDKYKKQGFVVIGVHTPELAFERTLSSINQAISTYGIHYPVAQDNDYKTWYAYNNQYWPALYLVDKKGIIRREHSGEGEYDQTETAIQTLLKEQM